MWQFDTPKAFLKDHWMAIAAVMALATISTLVFLPTKFIGGQTRVGIVIFGLSAQGGPPKPRQLTAPNEAASARPSRRRVA